MLEQIRQIHIGDLDLLSGHRINDVTLSYSIHGTPCKDGSNIILVCHALTGSHHVAGASVPRLPEAWWETMVGSGKALNTEKLCIICFNNLCSPYGSTAPCTVNQETGLPWGMDLPVVTPRDIAKSQKTALQLMGISRVALVVGASFGGMVALEFALMYPLIVSCCIVIAAPARLYPQAIAYNEVQRQAITSDPNWKQGSYYPGMGPVEGLSVARMLAMITYRSERSFASRWMRQEAQGNVMDWDGKFQVESYLHHHGNELVRRFDANCYLYLTKAMDLHDIGTGRGGIEEALALYKGKNLLAVGISSDILFPNWQVQEISHVASSCGVNASYEEIESEHGHDSFLIDFDQLDEIIRGYLRGCGIV